MKKIIIFLSFLIFWGGCSNEVEIIEEIPDPNLTLNQEIAVENNSENDQIIEQFCNNEQLEECEKKATSCIKDLKAANEKINVLQTSLGNKEKEIEKQKNNLQTENWNHFFVDYFKNVPQNEYPFDSCGKVSIFWQKDWFKNFEQALGKANIFFSPAARPLQGKDFFGGCVSSSGGMAFFLGASFQNKNEFHLVKFDIQTSSLKKAILAKGSCQDCPANFGKRNGPYVELLGDKGTKYRYFFDKNVLMEGIYFE